MNEIHIATNKLPGSLGAALFLAEVSTRDIAFKAADRAYASVGGDGTRAWLVVVPDLASPDGMKRYTSAFGGPNPYEKREIDAFANVGIEVPINGAILTGAGRYSVCYVRAATLAKILAPEHPATMVALDALGSDKPEASADAAREVLQAHAEKNAVSNGIRWTLYVFKALKSSYRKDALRELAQKTNGACGTVEAIEDCIKRGLLARKGSGIQITTEGRNLAREAPYRADAVTAGQVSA